MDGCIALQSEHVRGLDAWDRRMDDCFALLSIAVALD